MLKSVIAIFFHSFLIGILIPLQMGARRGWGFRGGGGYFGGEVCWMLDRLRGYVGGREYVGGRGKLGRGGGGVGFLTWRAGQKRCFWAFFGKLRHFGRPWMNVFVRVLQRRETLSLEPRPGKTAQKPLKNHRKKWAVFERFFKQDLSGLSGFSKKNRPNRPNRSNFAGKPLKPLKFWAVFERDLDPAEV